MTFLNQRQIRILRRFLRKIAQQKKREKADFNQSKCGND